jgi:carbon storage regulator
MLVIRRRAGEAILIAGGIEIEVLETTSGRVKLGIRAPREIAVLRKEVQMTGLQNLTAARHLPPELLDGELVKLGRKFPSNPGNTR